MPTERVNLSLEKAALAAARSAAAAAQVSLSEWLSKAAWDRAIRQAAQAGAEQDKLLPREASVWDEDIANRIFGPA